MSNLEKPELLEAREGLAPEHDVIDEGYAQDLAGPGETIRQGLVFLRRMRIAARMIVEGHDRTRAEGKGGLEHVGRADRDTVSPPGGHDLLAQKPVSRVQSEDAEHLGGVRGVAGRQVGRDRLRSVELRPRRRLFAMQAAPKLEGGEEAQGFGETQAGVTRQSDRGGLGHGPETARSERSREVEDAVPRGAGTQEHSQKLGVVEGLGSEGRKPLPRAIG